MKGYRLQFGYRLFRSKLSYFTRSENSYIIAMGNIYRGQEKYELAEEKLLGALEMYKESLPEVHFYPSRAHIALSRVYLQTNRYDEAMQHADKALDIREQTSRPGSWMIGEATLLKGKCLLALGNTTKGNALLQESLDILEKALPTTHKLSKEARELLVNGTL